MPPRAEGFARRAISDRRPATRRRWRAAGPPPRPSARPGTGATPGPGAPPAFIGGAFVGYVVGALVDTIANEDDAPRMFSIGGSSAPRGTSARERGAVTTAALHRAMLPRSTHALAALTLVLALAAAPPTARAERKWYGWQILAADAFSGALILGGSGGQAVSVSFVGSA